MRLPPLSLETLIGLFVGLLVGLVEMSWELRSLGVLFTAGLAVHIAKRLDVHWLAKIAIAVVGIGVLAAGTWRPIWTGFHEDFPSVTGQQVLARIIEFATLAASAFAAYVFLIRPRGKKGYRVLPAQVIAFGACVMVCGLAAVAIGLIWQFQQNWAAGIKPSGAPTFTIGPPQIAPPAATPALPPPSRNQEAKTPFFSNYNLTDSGVAALADELYKARDTFKRRIELSRMNTDGTSGPFISNFGRACDEAGVECPVNAAHPNSPDEKGLLIYVADASKPPTAAEELRTILLKLGINVPFVIRSGFGEGAFSLFVGPRPQD